MFFSLVCRLSVASVQGSITMRFGHNKPPNLPTISTQPHFVVQEAIPHGKSIPPTEVGSDCLFVQDSLQCPFECFMRCPKVLDDHIDYGVVMLSLLPVCDM